MPTGQRPAARLLVLSPRQAARWRPAGGSDYEWHYLGSDMERRDRLGARLDAEKRGELADELKAAAARLRQPYLDWVAGLGRAQPEPRVWWCTTLASKGTLHSDFFLLLCYGEVVAQWLASPSERLRVLVVEDPWLARLLRQRHRDEPGAVFRCGGVWACGWSALGWLARFLLVRAYSVAWGGLLWAASRLLAREKAIPGPASARLVCIYTWLEERCFQRPGHLSDPYTARLDEIVSKGSEPVLRLAGLLVDLRLLARLGAVQQTVLLPARHTTALDVLRAGLGWPRILLPGGFSRLEGREIGALLTRELLREAGRPSYCRHRLWYFSTLRTARRFGPRIRAVVYPFENHPWEKAFCLAWREAAPRVRLVGYQHTAVQPLLLNFFLGRGEAELSPLPDRIVANSARTLQILQEAGYPAARLSNGGALRYEHMHSPPPRIPASQRRERNVLVVFPLSRPHCAALLLDLARAFRDPLRLDGAAGEPEPIRLHLKPHPWLPLSDLGCHRPALGPWVLTAKQALADCLPWTDLLLYAAPTTAWSEAYLQGIPVLKYRPEVLDIDFTEQLLGAEVPCCTGKDLRQAVARALEEGSRRPAQADGSLVARMFERVNEALWREVTLSTPSGAP